MAEAARSSGTGVGLLGKAVGAVAHLAAERFGGHAAAARVRRATGTDQPPTWWIGVVGPLIDRPRSSW